MPVRGGATTGAAECIEHRLGCAVVALHSRREGEVVGGCQCELALDRLLRVAAPAVPRVHPQASQHHRGGCVGIDVDGGHRHSHDLGVDAKAQLGETNRGGAAVDASHALGDTRDRDRDRNARRHRHRLALAGQRLWPEHNVNWIAGRVASDAHRTDPSIGHQGLGLQEPQCAIGGRDVQEVSDRVAAVSHHPGGGRVAIDRHGRALLGAIGKRLAVPAGSDDQPGVERCDCLIVSIRNRPEDGQALVALVDALDVAAITAGFGEATDVLRATPVVCAITIRIGDNHGRAVELIVGGHIGGVAQRLVALQ